LISTGGGFPMEFGSANPTVIVSKCLIVTPRSRGSRSDVSYSGKSPTPFGRECPDIPLAVRCLQEQRSRSWWRTESSGSFPIARGLIVLENQVAVSHDYDAGDVV
jgi:hypothetical protein